MFRYTNPGSVAPPGLTGPCPPGQMRIEGVCQSPVKSLSVSTPQRAGGGVDPWDCAEWCANKWWHPGYFPEYQKCVDDCEKEWGDWLTSIPTTSRAYFINQACEWLCKDIQPALYRMYCIERCKERLGKIILKPKTGGVPGEAGDADLEMGRAHGRQGVWHPEQSHFGARGPYGQGWKEARETSAFSTQYDEFLRQANPIKGMPGGSVTGCIKMHADKDDPGAYCAAIADRIEPGWRHHNPLGGV